MKLRYALPLALLLSAAGQLRADFVTWSVTARVILDDDNGHRVPGLQSGTLLHGTIGFDDGAGGVAAPPPASGLSYPAANGVLDFTVNGVHLGGGTLPVTASVTRIPASQFSPYTLHFFRL